MREAELANVFRQERLPPRLGRDDAEATADLRRVDESAVEDADYRNSRRQSFAQHGHENVVGEASDQYAIKSVTCFLETFEDGFQAGTGRQYSRGD